MNQEQILSIVRQVMMFGGGLAVARGWIDAGTLTTIVGALVALIASAWSIYTRRTTGLVASAAASPSVSSIVALPHVADAVPSPKVTSR